MKKVFKYQVGTDRFELDMPVGAKVLSIHAQNGIPQMWALVDPENDVERRRFCLVGTGHQVPDSYCEAFVGTFLIHGDSLVFHLFERAE